MAGAQHSARDALRRPGLLRRRCARGCRSDSGFIHNLLICIAFLPIFHDALILNSLMIIIHMPKSLLARRCGSGDREESRQQPKSSAIDSSALLLTLAVAIEALVRSLGPTHSAARTCWSQSPGPPNMGIFDRLRGKREEPADMSSAEAAAAVSPSLDLTEAPTPSFGASTRQKDFEKTFGAPAEQLYNPYEGAKATPGSADSLAEPHIACSAYPRCGVQTAAGVDACAAAAAAAISPLAMYTMRPPCRSGRGAGPTGVAWRLPRLQPARVFVQRGGAGAPPQLEREPHVLYGAGLLGG